ncbi:MAG: hypothetical protein LQ345_004745 [Seirophora villosa]|nr:MAG: hypothetical protein LQ345_004745 [Seirophora villosa]
MATDNADFELHSLFNVEHKVALVTGGATGIGLMAAQALAVNGARVYILGRTESKLRIAADVHGQNIRGDIIPLVGDVANKEDIKRLVQEVETKEEALHLLINNAGIYSASQQAVGEDASQARENLFDPPSATFDDWTNVYRTNAASHYFVTTAFLPLLARGSAPNHPGYQSCVINISSINGLIRTSLNHFASNAAKAATIHVTKMLATEIARMKLHIRVNSIAPGVFPSEITTGTPSLNGKSTLDEESWPAVKEISSGRVGTHLDMGSAIMFVACCQYLNGARTSNIPQQADGRSPSLALVVNILHSGGAHPHSPLRSILWAAALNSLP